MVIVPAGPGISAPAPATGIVVVRPRPTPLAPDDGMVAVAPGTLVAVDETLPVAPDDVIIPVEPGELENAVLAVPEEGVLAVLDEAVLAVLEDTLLGVGSVDKIDVGVCGVGKPVDSNTVESPFGASVGPIGAHNPVGLLVGAAGAWPVGTPEVGLGGTCASAADAQAMLIKVKNESLISAISSAV